MFWVGIALGVIAGSVLILALLNWAVREAIGRHFGW